MADSESGSTELVFRIARHDQLEGGRQLLSAAGLLAGRSVGFDLELSEYFHIRDYSGNVYLRESTTGGAFQIYRKYGFLQGPDDPVFLDDLRFTTRSAVVGGFIQDSWSVMEKFTINAGLRYTLNFPSTEASDQVGVFNLETREMEYLGRDGQPRAARQLHKLDFGPRLGIVGQLSRRMVARAGYARVFIEMAGITTPFTTPAFPFLQTVSQRTLDNLVPAFVLADGPTV